MVAQENLNSSVHIMLQGKGGVGKSTLSALACQYLQEQVPSLYTFDTDTENNTLSQYKALSVNVVDVLAGDEIDPGRFDGLLETLLSADGAFFIDNGANTFRPLLAYMIANQVVQMLEAAGKKVYIHTVIMGGDVQDTVAGAAIAANLCEGTNARLVCWINERDAPAAVGEIDIMQTRGMQNLLPLTAGVIRVPLMQALFAADFKALAHARLTVREARESSSLMLMQKQRIKIITDKIFAQLASVNW